MWYNGRAAAPARKSLPRPEERRMTRQSQSIPAPAAPARRKAPARAVVQVLAVLAITLGLLLPFLDLRLPLFAPPAVPPIAGLFTADPATAYRLAPGARVPFRFAEGNTTSAVNSQGLRAAHEIGPPAPGTTRLLNLGDSFTF